MTSFIYDPEYLSAIGKIIQLKSAYKMLQSYSNTDYWKYWIGNLGGNATRGQTETNYPWKKIGSNVVVFMASASLVHFSKKNMELYVRPNHSERNSVSQLFLFAVPLHSRDDVWQRPELVRWVRIWRYPNNWRHPWHEKEQRIRATKG